MSMQQEVPAPQLYKILFIVQIVRRRVCIAHRNVGLKELVWDTGAHDF